MEKKRNYKLIAAILLVCMLLCGCTEEKKAVPKTENTKSVQLQMRFAASFNPLLVEHQSVRDALSLCYEPLFAIDNKMQSVGILAEDIVISDDCMSAVITLKDSVLWHDGIKLTSADVVYTVEFLKNNHISSYYDCVKNIDVVKSIDPLTVQLTFSEPQGHIAYSLYFPIIASHNGNVDENIVGTGPYMFENYTEAVSLEFKKYDSWHAGSAACDKMTVTVGLLIPWGGCGW